MENRLFDQFRNDVANQDMAFLNARCLIRGGTNTVIRRTLEFTASASSKSGGG